MDYYKDKTILITGASSGIGENFAHTLNEMGAKLILTARSEDKLKQMASSMNNAVSIPGDLSKKEFPEELYNKINDMKIKVDIVINNAGFGYSGKFLDNSMENYNEMINLNKCIKEVKKIVFVDQFYLILIDKFDKVYTSYWQNGFI